MKLQNKINLFSLTILMLFAIPLITAGYISISKIIYELNSDLFNQELVSFSKKIQESYDTLEYTGVLTIKSYLQSAQENLKHDANKFNTTEYNNGEFHHQTGRLAILDTSGTVITHHRYKKGELFNRNALKILTNQEKGSLNYTDNGEDYYTVFTKFPQWNWILLFEVNEKEIFVTRDRYLNFVIITACIIFFIIILLSHVVTRRISQRLTLILKYLARVQKGDLTVRIPITQQDEIGIIQEGINLSIAKNEQFYQTLEQKVADRTADLAVANDEITSLYKQLKADNRRMELELDITRHLQQMVLPKPEELLQIKQLDIAGFMEPATEVGGDYYEILQYDNRIKIGIGDVTGHGLESGVLMLMVQVAVRTLLVCGIEDKKQFLNIINQTIFANLQRMQSDKNLSLSLLDYHAGELHLVGQHEEVLVIRESGEVECIDTFELGFTIGLEPDISAFIQDKKISLNEGDGIVLYTDGVTEAENDEGNLYGVERLCVAVSKAWHLDAKGIKQAIIHDVKQHIGNHEIYDDITLLVMKQR